MTTNELKIGQHVVLSKNRGIGEIIQVERYHVTVRYADGGTRKINAEASAASITTDACTTTPAERGDRQGSGSRTRQILRAMSARKDQIRDRAGE